MTAEESLRNLPGEHMPTSPLHEADKLRWMEIADDAALSAARYACVIHGQNHTLKQVEAERARRVAKATLHAADFSARTGAHTSGNTGTLAREVSKSVFATSGFWYFVGTCILSVAIAYCTMQKPQSGTPPAAPSSPVNPNETR
jgi:hypothetical protein